jgi:hypothetical protein
MPLIRIDLINGRDDRTVRAVAATPFMQPASTSWAHQIATAPK